MSWLAVSAGLMAVTAAAHSFLSETRLMPGLGSRGLHRTIMRYALHAMSVFMLLSAITVVWPGVPASLATVVGVGWVAVGVAGLLVSRGRHLGWPVITAAGACAIVGGLR